jgi:hypothetical protein
LEHKTAAASWIQKTPRIDQDDLALSIFIEQSVDTAFLYGKVEIFVTCLTAVTMAEVMDFDGIHDVQPDQTSKIGKDSCFFFFFFLFFSRIPQEPVP